MQPRTGLKLPLCDRSNRGVWQGFNHAPATAIPIAAIRIVTGFSTNRNGWCAAKMRHCLPIRRKSGTPVLDHSIEMWNFCRDRSLTVLFSEKGEAMSKTLMAIAAAATLAFSAVAAPAPASPARRRRGWRRRLIGGASSAARFASQRGYYGPGYYGPGYGYYGGPAMSPSQLLRATPALLDGYGWRVRNVQVATRPVHLH